MTMHEIVADPAEPERLGRLPGCRAAHMTT